MSDSDLMDRAYETRGPKVLLVICACGREVAAVYSTPHDGPLYVAERPVSKFARASYVKLMNLADSAEPTTSTVRVLLDQWPPTTHWATCREHGDLAVDTRELRRELANRRRLARLKVTPT